MSAAVLIVDDRYDVLELSRIMLESEGYETVSRAYREVTLEWLRQQPPGVMLLDLVAGDEAPWSLLRRVRSDPDTAGIGVVVTSDIPALVDRALRDTSLRVTAGLVMPFDIEAFYTAISTAARGAPVAAPPAPPVPVPLFEHAASTLRRTRTNVLLRWVQRLSALPAFQRRPDLSLVELQGQGAALLDGVISALELRAPSPGIAVMSDAGLAAARSHACLRRAQGVGVGDLGREMAALRREIGRDVQATAGGGAEVAVACPAADLWALARRLDAALDAALCAMLDVWDEKRASEESEESGESGG